MKINSEQITYELAKGLLKKDENSCRLFYSRYSALFLGICLRYIPEKMAAEDVMLEAIMKIFDKISTFEFKGSFEGWAKRIVVNEALQYLRKNKIVFETIDNLNVANNELENFDETISEDKIMNEIGNLPVGFRTVFNLFAIEGFSHEEIAKTLGITVGTSKSQLSRARKHIIEKLK